LELAYSAGRQHHVSQILVPRKLKRRWPSGRTEKWSEVPRKTTPGHLKTVINYSTHLLSNSHTPIPETLNPNTEPSDQKILGIGHNCIECHNVYYCFKCYGHRAEIHNAEHLFMERWPLCTKMSLGPLLLCRKPAHGRLSGKIKRARKRVTFYEVIDISNGDEQRVGDLSETDVSTEEYDEDENMDGDWDGDWDDD
jgi:hypothetical protein